MTRRPNPPSSPPILTAEQIRRRIKRLEACIQELQEFKPELVQKRYNIAEVDALEASIRDALITAFGDGTPHFNLYQQAAYLDQGTHFAQTYDAQEAQEARRYLTEGKERSILLLQRAIKTLEDQIADHMEATAPPPFQPLASGQPRPKLSRKVFVVHGHDEVAKLSVAGFLKDIGFEAIILHEQTNLGRTIIEKLEAHCDVGFAVVLLTPDDRGGDVDKELRLRARQNVIMEWGYFIARLGRSHVCALRKGDVELPSDIDGIVWQPFDDHGAWKRELAKELEDTGFEIDWKKVGRS